MTRPSRFSRLFATLTGRAPQPARSGAGDVAGAGGQGGAAQIAVEPCFFVPTRDAQIHRADDLIRRLERLEAVVAAVRGDIADVTADLREGRT